MPSARWLCPCCCSKAGTPYQLPPTADLRCRGCAAPMTSDDIEAVASGSGAAGMFPVPHDFFLEPSPVEESLRQLREDVSRIGTVLAELKTTLGAPPKTAVSVVEAAQMLGCGRSQVFMLLAEGKLRRGRRVGRQATVTLASIQALQEGSAVATQPARRRPRSGTRGATSGAAILALPLPGSNVRR